MKNFLNIIRKKFRKETLSTTSSTDDSVCRQLTPTIIKDELIESLDTLYAKNLKMQAFYNQFYRKLEDDLQISYNKAYNNIINHIDMELIINPIMNTFRNYNNREDFRNFVLTTVANHFNTFFVETYGQLNVEWFKKIVLKTDRYSKIFNESITKALLLEWLIRKSVSDIAKSNVPNIKYLVCDINLFYTRRSENIASLASYIATVKDVLTCANISQYKDEMNEDGTLDMDKCFETYRRRINEVSRALPTHISSTLKKFIVECIEYLDERSKDKLYDNFIINRDDIVTINLDTEVGSKIAAFRETVLGNAIAYLKDQLQNCIKFDMVERVMEECDSRVYNAAKVLFDLYFFWR